MPRPFNASQLRSQVRAAQRKAEHAVQQEIKRAAQRAERSITQEIKKTSDKLQRQAAQQNARALADLNRRANGRRPTSTVRYTPEEQVLAERVQSAVAEQPDREYDVFISYARIDGSSVAAELRECLVSFGVSCWLDTVEIRPGVSQSLQMDRGLRSARAGIAVVTAAYLTGRFWTERELGALLHKPTLIPVLHNVTFGDVAEYSSFLTDLAGFETARDSVSVIAEKIMGAVATGSQA